MSFQQGLSGLNMSAKALDAVGNNISNVGTVGFKGATAQFRDIYAASLTGARGNANVGQGGSITTVAQAFTQGNITNTNNPLDIAINGNGFLRFQPTLTDATAEYSRNGQMHLDRQGYLVNANDNYLVGYTAPGGILSNSGATVPLQVDSGLINPRATGFMNSTAAGATGPGSGGIEIGMNFDVRDKRADPTMTGAPMAEGWTQIDPWNFATLNPNMYNYSTAATVFDQRGEPHVLSMYAVRQSTVDSANNTIGSADWQMHFIMDGQYEISAYDRVTMGPLMSLSFDSNGRLASPPEFELDLDGALTGIPPLDVNGNGIVLNDPAAFPAPPNLDWFPNPTVVPNYSLSVDFDGATQFGSSYDVNSLTQDGFAPGRLSGLSIDADGNISARYSNGQTSLMGQVALTTFQNPNGLMPVGNNMWVETGYSGAGLEGSPNTGSRGTIQAGAVEDANIDLTVELVNMITLQRAYQANAQTIKTQDSILQTLVNLR